MINLKGVVKKLNLSRFIIHEKLMCVGIRLIISVTFLLLVVSVRLQAQDTKVSHPFMWKSFNNPAYSGFDGLAGVNIGMQRSYWSKPLDFRSYFVSADYAFQEKRTFGLGGLSLFYQRDQESSVMYVTQLFSAALSARVKLSRSTVFRSVCNLAYIEYRHFIGIKTHQLRGDIQNLTVKRIELISQCQLRGIHAFTI